MRWWWRDGLPKAFIDDIQESREGYIGCMTRALSKVGAGASTGFLQLLCRIIERRKVSLNTSLVNVAGLMYRLEVDEIDGVLNPSMDNT